MSSERLILGIDGGGTKTIARLARWSAGGEPLVIGQGTAGPANPQAVGTDRAIEQVERAVAAARQSAAEPALPLAAAVLGLAGSDRPENRRGFCQWAERYRLAERFRIVHDALPVLVAGSPQGWGVALIAGTGSLAFGQSPLGRTARSGGWGFLFGDEGGGYAIALAGLRASAKAADGRGPPTTLLEAFLERLGLQQPEDLIPAVYAVADKRAQIAAMASVVTHSADQGDAVATAILEQQARELAEMVAAVAKSLELSGEAFPLALAGGVLLGSGQLRRRLEPQLAAFGLRTASVELVSEPVVGALRMAAGMVEG